MNVHHAHMSTLVIEVCMVHWFCLSFQLVTSLVRLMKNTGCGLMSMSHTPNQALLRLLVMLNSWLCPLFNITQFSQLGLIHYCFLDANSLVFCLNIPYIRTNVRNTKTQL